MDITHHDQTAINQLSNYIELKDVISYCHTFPNELEKTAKEDYQKGLINKDEFNYLLKKVAENKKGRKKKSYG